MTTHKVGSGFASLLEMLRACIPIAALCAALLGSPAQAQNAQALRTRHAAMQQELANNDFGRPLHVESSAGSDRQQGDVYAALEQPYRILGPALSRIEHWCDIVILLANVKRCEAEVPSGTLSVFISRKPTDSLDSAYQVDFRYEIATARDDYLDVVLAAPNGPMGTSNYRMRLEATPLDAQRTFLHLSYSYATGLATRIAVQGYLATTGRHKVGFSVVDRLPDGRPVYVDGLRGIVERNAMRYYLAIEAYLGTLDAPPSQRLETRLRDWYAATERYPQLEEEVDRNAYLRMKREEAQHTAWR